MKKKYLYIAYFLMFHILFSFCGCGNKNISTPSKSDIYNNVNKEDNQFNKNDETSGGQGYIGSSEDKLEVIPDDIKDVTPKEPIEIETTVALKPTPTIEVSSENYTCVTLEAPNGDMIYVPFIGNFVEARKTEHYTPSNNKNQIGMFWNDIDDTILTTIVVEKNDVYTDNFFYNFIHNYFNGLVDREDVDNIVLSERMYTPYKDYTIYSYVMTYEQLIEEKIIGKHYELCYVEKDNNYIYSILVSKEDVIDMSIIIDTMYPVILDYDDEIVEQETLK